MLRKLMTLASNVMGGNTRALIGKLGQTIRYPNVSQRSETCRRNTHLLAVQSIQKVCKIWKEAA